MKKITILDYGLGNLMSVKRAIEYNGFKAEVSNLREEIESSTHLIIPGVGSFNDAINSLKSSSLDNLIINHAKKGRLIFGICLGMQLLADCSYEGGLNEGLGLVSGEVSKLPLIDEISKSKLKIPNIGWRTVYSENPSKSILFDKDTNYKEYYHVHSYHFIPKNNHDVMAKSEFGNSHIVVGVRNANIFGTQFHPEKSDKTGLNIIDNFLSL